MPEEKPAVSVITPFYNAEDTLESLLLCYSKQDIQLPWEIIFVDNRSSDNSCQVINDFSGELPPFKILKAGEMAGAGYSRNVGVASCSSKTIVFCDADDEIPDHHISKMAEGVGAHGWIGCGIDDKKLNSAHIAKALGFAVMDLLNAGYMPFTGTGLMAIRKDLFEKVGGFDTAFRVCEDADFCYRLQLLGHSLHYQPDTSIFVRLRPNLKEICKQRFQWGRYERTLARRYTPYGHAHPDSRIKGFVSAVKTSIFFLLRCYDQEKRIRYGRLTSHQLGVIMPLQKEAHVPVMLDEKKIDPGVLKKLKEGS
jgi:glycosyltransferase involved in cell wall biosynthesis